MTYIKIHTEIQAEIQNKLGRERGRVEKKIILVRTLAIRVIMHFTAVMQPCLCRYHQNRLYKNSRYGGTIVR